MGEHVVFGGDIPDERIVDILDKMDKDWVNLSRFSNAVKDLLREDVAMMPQEDRQKLVEAYNLYRAAPYDWYYRVE